MKSNYPMTVIFFITFCLILPQAGFSDQNQGAIISLQELTTKEQEFLVSGIQSAEKQQAQTFPAVQNVRDTLPVLDLNKRGPLAIITPALKSLGKEALFPLLKHIAVDDPGQNGLTDTAWLAWRVSLLEAVGMLRDERSAPVLKAILESNGDDFLVLQAAATSYAKLGSDMVARDLISMLSKPDPLYSAIITGMGYCRRHIIAQQLGVLLQEKPDSKTALIIARALGSVGSAWAWRTEIISRCGEEMITRTTAVQALIDSYLVYDRDVQKIMTQAILVVDHPDTLNLIEQVKAQSTRDTHDLLDQLARRFQQSPLH